MDDLIQDLAHREYTLFPEDAIFRLIQNIKTKSARHSVLVELEVFNSELQHIVDGLCLPCCETHLCPCLYPL